MHLCVYAVVPASPTATISENAPPHLWKSEGPDEVHLGIHSEETHIQLETPTISPLFPVQESNWTQSNLHAHVYAGEAVVEVAVSYQATAETGLVRLFVAHN